jgi:hypothetical protein
MRDFHGGVKADLRYETYDLGRNLLDIKLMVLGSS